MYELFKKIKLKNLLLLCKLCIETEGDNDFVVSKYNAYADYYQETFNFLEKLHILDRNNESHKYVARKVTSPDSENIDGFLKDVILESIFEKEGEVSKEIHGYLSNYIEIEDSYAYRPTNLQRNIESDIRNLLIELEVVSYLDKSNTYYLNPSHFPFILLNLNKKYISADRFDEILKSKKQLGYDAELVVLEYENNKLSKYNEVETEHTSQINVGAGYDIKSWEENDEGLIEKYIEVKAIQVKKAEFYWSRNEVEVSRKFKDRYYLYLLPVDKKRKFDIDNLIQIQNPHKKVFNNNSWIKEVESYHIKKNI